MPVHHPAPVSRYGRMLLAAAQKLAPALAAGCTVVLKPSEYATFAVLRLAGLIEEAGLPPGVLNVVTGPGDPTGDALIHHPMVSKLSFTGSRAVGRKIIEASAVAPTLFTDVSNDMSIAREEIFGPVLSVIPFSDEQEAVRIANDTEYGLAATVWTADIKRAMRMTKALRAGTVGINGYQLEPHAAFGGFRQSGIGREGGRPAIEAYTELKTVLLPFTDEMM
jgi:acyl-CoA reductase-like NAD-dependent aldehyde dehydrogenase